MTGPQFLLTGHIHRGSQWHPSPRGEKNRSSGGGKNVGDGEATPGRGGCGRTQKPQTRTDREPPRAAVGLTAPEELTQTTKENRP